MNSSRPVSEPPMTTELRDAVESSTAGSAFALVDGALLRDMPDAVRRIWPASRARSLLTGSTGRGAAEAGPLLFEISRPELANALPATLLDAATGRSAGSFIVSRLPLGELAIRLMRFADVKLADNTTMVMRFFDPRVLPFWLEIVRPRHSVLLAETVSRWIYWDARQAVTVERFEEPGPEATDERLPLRISEAEEQRLLDACYPFTLIERFRSEDPDALARVPVIERQAFFSAQIERARAHSIESNVDIEVYCGLAIQFGEHFDERPAMRPAFERTANGSNLAAALATLADADWASMKGTP